LGNATKLFGGLFPPSIPGLLSRTSGGRKNKKTELDDKKLVCVMKSWKERIYCPPWQKCWETRPPSATSGLLSLTSGSRKNKRTELNDIRLTLRHAKVGGTKALASTLAKKLGRVSLGFTPMVGAQCGYTLFLLGSLYPISTLSNLQCPWASAGGAGSLPGFSFMVQI